MSIKKHIPNAITLLNLFSGCVAVTFALQSEFELAFYFVALGIFFDFFDGFFARLFKVSSPLGLQLDSLADMVTSGLTPGIVMLKMLSNSALAEQYNWLPYFGFIITLGSCYRLANFNIDTRQTDSFIGLPTPANALFVLSLPLILKHSDIVSVEQALTNPWILIGISMLSAYILNAEIPLFSLKIKKFDLKANGVQIVFLLTSLFLLLFFHFLGVALVILFYVLLSVVLNQLKKG